MKALNHAPCIGVACALVSLTLLAGACKATTAEECDPGYHDDGTGSCVLVGSCAGGYRDGGGGTCAVAWPYSCAPGYHDDGLGTCVVDGTGCAPGVPWNDALSICSEWELTGSPVVAAREMSSYSSFAVALPNGGVLLGGGWLGGGPYAVVPEYEIWDPLTSTWSVAGTMLHPRYSAKAVALADGRVLVAGGEFVDGAEYGRVSEAEVYDPATMRSVPAGTMNTTRYLLALTRLASGKVLAISGDPADGSATAEVWDPATSSWVAVAPPSLLVEYDLTATLLDDGRVLVMPGRRVAPEPSHAEIYDPADDAWIETAAMPVAEVDSSVRLADGSVLAVGVDRDPDGNVTSPSVGVRYDPVADAWAPPVPLGGGSNPGGAAVLSASGKVIILSGLYSEGSGIYDPVATDKTPVGANIPSCLDPPQITAGGWVLKGYFAYDLPRAIRLADGRVMALGLEVPPQIYVGPQ